MPLIQVGGESGEGDAGVRVIHLLGDRVEACRAHLDHRAQQGLPVGEVAVQGATAEPGRMGDRIPSDAFGSVARTLWAAAMMPARFSSITARSTGGGGGHRTILDNLHIPVQAIYDTSSAIVDQHEGDFESFKRTIQRYF